jgi:ABC-type amino acid transport substrate-binding protein
MTQRTSWALALSAVAALSVAACAKAKDEADSLQTSAGAIADAPKPVEIADVTIGKAIGADKKVTDATDNLKIKDTVFASVHTTGNQTANVSARWNFQDGTVVEERTESVSPKGDAYTAFFITKPTGLPVGKYTIHVMLDGKEVSTKEFKVEK